MLRIGIVAGEASGDYLGAELIRALKEKHDDIVVEGVGGKKLQAEGCINIFPMEKLAVMGIVEVLGSYFELLGVRRQLVNYFSSNPPDIFIGIDAPDFNLGLEHSLRGKGVLTVHYVSPSVWAWRKYRIRKIARCVDLMLTLFPFEIEIYKQHNIPVEFVGHPLADKISMQPDKYQARRRLGLEEDKIIVGIMPGSRKSELQKLWSPFLKTADLFLKSNSNTQFISSVLDRKAVNYCEQVQRDLSLEHLPLTIYRERAHDVLEAADVVLLASGTITLEAMLFKRPMVVAYRLNPITHYFVKILSYIDHASLPNLLGGGELVPERLQKECIPENLYHDLQHWQDNPEEVSALEDRFTRIHESLNVHNSAAAEVLSLLDVK